MKICRSSRKRRVKKKTTKKKSKTVYVDIDHPNFKEKVSKLVKKHWNIRYLKMMIKKAATKVMNQIKNKKNKSISRKWVDEFIKEYDLLDLKIK